jgi:hypothetical protein
MNVHTQLELARAKLTNRYLAENVDLAEAEKLRHDLTEVCRFLERRIAREKVNVAKESQPVVTSAGVAKFLDHFTAI